MPTFDPTRAPNGRLARLGVVLDGSMPVARLVALARMCERAGIDVVWIQESAGDDGPGSTDAFDLAGQAADGLERVRLGVMVEPGRRAIGELATAAAELAERIGRPLEVAVQTDGALAIDDVRALIDELTRVGPAGRPRISAAAAGAGDFPALLSVVDDLVLPSWHHPDLEAAADAARTAALDGGRDPATLGIAVLLPVSIGRTGAEASARADVDSQFTRLGHPAEIGIFGTLEECQDRVIALAHAGVSDLRCVLPGAPDVHDVIAQLTAMTVGTTDVLLPGALRSPAPPPPEGWGGRSPRPPRPMVSDGSRRR